VARRAPLTHRGADADERSCEDRAGDADRGLGRHHAAPGAEEAREEQAGDEGEIARVRAALERASNRAGDAEEAAGERQLRDRGTG
jgi:hypothetical protein